MERQRAGKTGMEAGTLRERISVSLVIYKFGESNVETEIPVTQSETDVLLFKKPISIKTRTGSGLSGIKIIRTVDRSKVLEFKDKYTPSCDIIFAQIIWGDTGGLFYVPKEVQKIIFDKIGRNEYIKLPAQGTNLRGVEIAASALREVLEHKQTLTINVNWNKSEVDFNPYSRRVEHWEKN